MTTRADEFDTRWGKVKHTAERLDSTYTRHTYEGPRSAVIVTVGQALSRTTQMYEHMFTIDSLQSSERRLTVICTASNYAGD